ncbi:cysteine--tRNA ligase [Candidatus Dojkabacteria bacterium]|uniref:Cysteine--tRNA ligase n=1 Tax=Candidatus Dojkabacteria bacterium TaxID=2099670 RepID=A0A955LAZ3_9BACT|nr:cysteine--tRNA ligase [Candidatus Dojkabacteria bacterium]
MKIYNTLGRELQEFKPINEHQVSFYQCGPTVYSRQHIGNLYSALKGDLIRRTLVYLGYEVKYVKNITDVGHLVSDEDEGEDKMEKGAKKEGITPSEIAKRYTDLYHNDLKKLDILEPDVETVATQYVKKMADMVQDLLNNGYAYVTDKAIYFDVDKFKNYTELSGQKLEENKIGAGHGDEGDSEKKNPYDFAVWFFKVGKHANALQTWKHKFEGLEQPTEEGFPGWHIECSAMSKATLGDTIDIHMGGIEHIPTHHTNEIAQSEAANGAKFTNYWLHHEHLLMDGGKMSKSLGNVYTIEDLEEKGYSALDYRYFTLQSHYRSKQNFTWDALDSAKIAREKLENTIAKYKEQSSESTVNQDYKEKLKEALSEDFNIPKALGIIWEITKSDIPVSEKLGTILDFDSVLGLNLKDAELKTGSESYSPEVQELIDERNKAREEKNWEKADEIRDRLKAEFGIEVRDK